MEKVQISIFKSQEPNKTKNCDKLLSLAQEELAKVITKNAWSPGIFMDLDGKMRRSNDTWKGCGLLTYDVDEGMSLETAIQRFKKHRCIIGTSRSHQKQKGDKPPQDRFRLIFFLSERITEPNIYYSLWTNFVEKNQIPADPACKDLARFYFPCKEIVFLSNGELIRPTDYLNELKEERLPTKRLFVEKENGGQQYNVLEGARHSFLVEEMGRLRGRNFSQTRIEGELRDINQSFCKPPLPEEEVIGIVKSLKQRSFEEIVLYAPYTDLGNAERFCSYADGNIVFMQKMKKWMHYDGKRFIEDSGSMITKTATSCLREAQNLARKERESDLTLLNHHLKKSESLNRINAMVTLAQSELSQDPADYDSDPYTFNVLNGTIDLRTGKINPHKKSDLITKLSNVNFDEKADCPTFNKFLLDITCNNGALVEYLQRMVGYCLTGETKEQVFFLFYGEGSNGKTTFLDVLKGIFGEYFKNADISTFTTKQSEQIRNDLARLFDARLVTSVEIQEGKSLDESVIKQVTGGDVITARFLFKEHFEYKPKWKLIMAVNHLPLINGTDHGIWRRLKVIPFSASFKGKEIDKNLPVKLQQELPGILNWAIQGCLKWQKDGLVEPSVITSLGSRYRSDQDTFSEFISECILDSVPSNRVSASELHKVFADYQKDRGQKVLGQRTFSQKMATRGFKKIRGVGGRVFYSGIQIRTSTKIEPHEAIEDNCNSYS